MCEDDDDGIEQVPVPMSAETRARLKAFAERIGEHPVIAAGMLLEDLLDDEDFWDAVEDPAGVEPQVLQ